jgi:hypothetical protein
MLFIHSIPDAIRGTNEADEKTTPFILSFPTQPAPPPIHIKHQSLSHDDQGRGTKASSWILQEKARKNMQQFASELDIEKFRGED